MSDKKQPKLVVIITESVIETTLLTDLEVLGVKGFTISDVRGRGHRGTRAGEWGIDGNIRIEIVCGESLSDQILAFLEQKYYDNYAMITYCSDVSVIRPEKFLG
ncbi:transcriptional regulator [Kiloniella laminariae]|uniref:Nitrogen regulatory protein P-II n=1 Tax=Kiloniella laminariae TaxID=454162 RepID=A0ABT4LN95_9PROT|nr:transcriptional regulator [Kiloniella laminariae]MCZ4282557.1 transcriptional regulator [Kiloniella laminariae]